MTTKDTVTYTIAITLRNGQCFEHHPPEEPRTEMERTLQEILSEMAKKDKGIFTVPYPQGIYRMDDISSIHFLGVEPEDSSLPLGFHANK